VASVSPVFRRLVSVRIRFVLPVVQLVAGRWRGARRRPDHGRMDSDTNLSPAWLVLDDVSFGYGRGPDVNQSLSLALGPGIVGLLGPNGAGKSTLMRMLATLARPRRGRILWHGTDIAREPDALRRVLGYLPQDFGVYPGLSAREFLAFLAAVKGLPAARIPARVDECLALVALGEVADRPLAGFSGGMRQRVGIAQALLNDPQLLIVDEPTVGLDPGERLRFRHLLTELAGERLVLLSTHIVSDVEASAAALAVMKAGRLLFHGSPGSLVDAARGRAWDWAIPPAQLPAVRQAFVVSQSMHRGDSVQVRVLGPRPPGPGATAVAPSLEDAYTDLLARGSATDARTPAHA
jgi:ABC-2 type transport system ATP-binding protein